jgi:hypothetical protein
MHNDIMAPNLTLDRLTTQGVQKHTTVTLLVPRQVTSTIQEPKQITTTVMEPRQVSRTITEGGQVELLRLMLFGLPLLTPLSSLASSLGRRRR